MEKSDVIKMNRIRMTREQKYTVIKLIASAAFLVAGFFVPVKTIKTVLFICAYIIAGYKVILEAAENAVHGKIFDENFLMLVASAGAIALGEYPEAVAVMLFYGIGELFEDIAVGRSRASIRRLVNLAPEYAHVFENGKIKDVSPREIEVGDIIIIRQGEKIPVDSVIIDGETSLDTSALTGESLPSDVRNGDEIISGCINIGGVIKAKAKKKLENSTVSRILYLVEEAAEKKSKSESFITRFAKYYTPSVVISAVILAVVMSALTGNISKWVSRAVLLLVVSCPCALVIGVPLSFFCGIGRASKSGILIKGSNYLEALSRAEIAVFDKTGTLTKGKFRVKEINAVTMPQDELLEICAYAESFIVHPIAESVKEAYGKVISINETENAKQISGFGVSCSVFGKNVLVGNAALMEKNKIAYRKSESPLTVIYIAVDGEYAGNIVIEDEIKDEAEKTIAQLKKIGVKRTVMLTGDCEGVGRYISEKAGIDEFRAELLPQDKVAELSGLKKDGVTLYVGDGLNDAPVIIEADIGISMGAMGSDAAIEASDVVIMNDDIRKIPKAIKIGKKTMKLVRENIIFALGVKLAVMVLGITGAADMWLAVFADVGVTVIAILNAFRGLRK